MSCFLAVSIWVLVLDSFHRMESGYPQRVLGLKAIVLSLSLKALATMSRLGLWWMVQTFQELSTNCCPLSLPHTLSLLTLNKANLFLFDLVGKDAKRGILLDEECQVDIESAFYRETVAKKYASLFHSTLHHNTGYFLQVIIFSNGLFKLVFQNHMTRGRCYFTD